MGRGKKLPAPAVIAVLLMASCVIDGGVTGFHRTPDTYREMVSMNGGSIPGSSSYRGVFIDGRTVDISPFKIAKYQTTYELWKEVYYWAVRPENGYVFANLGADGYPHSASKEAGKGTDSTAWTAGQKITRPVTSVTWRDVIVWCNAYSEMSGMTPVYYTDASYSTVLKTSTNAEGTDTAADKAAVKAGADGYRLPTEAEWEYAARGGDPSEGAWYDQWAGTNEEAALGGYAWYNENSKGLGADHMDYGVHPVGTLKANNAGLFDMSGNVWEWCWDWYSTIDSNTPETGASSGTDRVMRGGSEANSADDVRSAIRKYNPPSTRYANYGFRVVRP